MDSRELDGSGISGFLKIAFLQALCTHTDTLDRTVDFDLHRLQVREEGPSCDAGGFNAETAGLLGKAGSAY